MRTIFLFMFTIMTGILSVSAQNQITGSVILASDKSPIIGANIMIKDTDGKILAYGVSDVDGHFSIKFSPTSGNLSINATMMGYKSYLAPFVSDGKPVVIRMEEGALQLQEVVVKSDRIRENGDTVTYYVNSFAQKQDRTIGDVMKRLPGIDVAKSGKIQYQGTDINKFYIEGSDLLGGRYGIATNGIAHEDIGAVEVLENHQPMQVLRGLSFSDQAAINLKLKNGAKATLLAHGSLSGGYSTQPKGALWQGELFTMMVKGKYQMMNTLKGNNTGQSLQNELMDFTSERLSETLNGYISLATPVTPNLQKNRSYFNRSKMLTSNHLIKTANGGEAKIQLDYNNDRVTAQGAGTTTYFLESGDKVILEDKSALTHRNALNGSFSYEKNEKTYFLNNLLSADLSWDNLTMNTIGTRPNKQMAVVPEYTVSNSLKVIKRFAGNKLVTFTSRNEWNALPEKLEVTNDGQAYGEKIKQHAVYTDEQASLGFVLGKVLLSLDAGVSGYFRNLNTDLFGWNQTDLDGSEHLTTDYLRLFASPRFEWSHKKLELTLNFPVNLYTYFFSGTLNNRTEFFLSPSLAAKFKFTPRMSLTVRGSAGRSPAALHDIHDSSILTDYRSFSQGVDDYYTSSGQSLSATYHYRNASAGLFVMMMGSYGWNKSKFGTVQNLIGDYVFYSYRSQPSDSRNAMAYLNLSKTLDFMRGAIGLNGNYRRLENNLLSQGIPTDYQNDSFSLSPYLNGNISSYLNWNLRLTWDKSLMKISNLPDRSTQSFTYAGSVTVTPCSLITWTTGGEFYRNEIEAGKYKKMFMLDTKLTFNISKRVELSASGTNLLNRKAYTYTSFGTVTQFERSYQLRGREFLLSLYIKK